MNTKQIKPTDFSIPLKTDSASITKKEFNQEIKKEPKTTNKVETESSSNPSAKAEKDYDRIISDLRQHAKVLNAQIIRCEQEGERCAQEVERLRKQISTQEHNNSPNTISVYTVDKKDGIYAISRRLGVSKERLIKLNPKVNWKALKIGQKINY